MRIQAGRAACLVAVAMLISGAAIGGPLARRAPVKPLRLPVADVQRGQQLFQGRCSMCHTVRAGGPNKFGPHLHGLFGRRAGSVPGYNYSAAIRASGIIWDARTLNAYLANPHRDIPGDKMPFPGMPNQADRDAVIAYLEQATR